MKIYSQFETDIKNCLSPKFSNFVFSLKENLWITFYIPKSDKYCKQLHVLKSYEDIYLKKNQNKNATVQKEKQNYNI